MNTRKINIAIVGLGFGVEFIPIYQQHPYSHMFAICQRDPDKLKKTAGAFGIERTYNDFTELLKDPDIDAVHINTPIQNHAQQTIAALRAGKHVACTVPMATSLADCQQIIRAVEETGLTYMMMETVIYSREFLFVREMLEKGELGRVQFLRAAHQQEMAGWPGYWEGLPPMHYATHCVGPVLALQKNEAEYVSCFGSGRIDEKLIERYGSPFAIETCHIMFRHSDLAAEITRSLFNTAREYRESFDVFGSKKSFEWRLREQDDHVVHLGELAETIKVPDYAHLLPKEIQHFTRGGVYDDAGNPHASFIQGSGHGGSHPHLVHEFLSAVHDLREPYPNAVQAANITCVGILAHESAMQGGVLLALPEFSFGR